MPEINMSLSPQASTIAPVPTPTNLPGIGKLLAGAWGIYRQHFLRLVGISLLPLIPLALSLTVLWIIWGFSGKSGSAPATLAFFVLIIGLIVSQIYFSLWSQAATILFLKDRAESLSVAEAYRRSKPFIGAIFTTGLLAALAIFGGILLLIIPGIIVSIWFSFAEYVVVMEGLRGQAAMQRSKWYVSGRIWQIFWRWAGVGILVAAAVMALTWLLGGGKEQQGPGDFVVNVIFFLLSPLFVAYGVLLYEQLKALKSQDSQTSLERPT